MSRGQTRRLQQQIESGVLGPERAEPARHEADLLGHPYVGLEHVELAQLRSQHDWARYREVQQELADRVIGPRRWWRPRGRHSALRTAGLRETEAAQRQATVTDNPEQGERG
jgi:hypothetical protein